MAKLYYFSMLIFLLAIAACDEQAVLVGDQEEESAQDAKNVEINCSDGRDNDGDGSFDLADSDCRFDSSLNEAPSAKEKLKKPKPPALAPLAESSGGSSGGGGSGGATDKSSTGNPDDFDNTPRGVCGNGIQEVLPQQQAPCPLQLYAADTDGVGAESTLYSIGIHQGLASPIGPIGFSRVSAIDFDPWGNLYGVGEDSGNGEENVLIKINCTTGEGTKVGPTGLTGGQMGLAITDINFDSNGRLIAYQNNSPDEIGELNILTGAYTSIGTNGLSDRGNGIGFSPFPADSLYHAGDSMVSTINRNTGVVAAGPPVLFPAGLTDPRINAIDEDSFSNINYVSIRSNEGNFLGTLNVDIGISEYLIDPPNEIGFNIDALAFNRVYEECDQDSDNPAPPNGSICGEDCKLRETLCNDKVDNDFDGLFDCEDPDCANLPCNDMDGCTLQDTCLAPEVMIHNGTYEPTFSCVGIPVDCEKIIGDLVKHDCTVDTCTSTSMDPGDNNFVCDSVFDQTKTEFGSCSTECTDEEKMNNNGDCLGTESDDLCTLGRCIEDDPAINSFCHEESKAQIPVAESGCKDDEECSADSCNPEDGQCIYETTVGLTCEKDGDKCTREVCQMMGSGMPGDEYSVECVLDYTEVCNDGNFCTDDSCEPATGDCIYASNTLQCDDNNACTINDICAAGTCAGTDDSQSCDDGDPCTHNFCEDYSGCNALELFGPVGGDCPIAQIAGQPIPANTPCSLGQFMCMGENPPTMCVPVFRQGDKQEICGNSIDDDCDGFVDEGVPIP